MSILRNKVKSVWDAAKRGGKRVKKNGKTELQYDVKGAYEQARVVVEGYYKKEEGTGVKARRLRSMQKQMAKEAKDGKKSI